MPALRPNDLFPWVAEDDEIALNHMQDIARPEAKTELLLNQPADEAGTEWSFPCGEKQPDDAHDEEAARYQHRLLRGGF
jgi:hypothetical protein